MDMLQYIGPASGLLFTLENILCKSSLYGARGQEKQYRKAF